jgi:hypothetical protein
MRLRLIDLALLAQRRERRLGRVFSGVAGAGNDQMPAGFDLLAPGNVVGFAERLDADLIALGYLAERLPVGHDVVFAGRHAGREHQGTAKRDSSQKPHRNVRSISRSQR